MPGRRQDLHSVLGRIALARGDAVAALREFRSALDAWPTPDAAAQQSALLASSGHPAEGLALLDHYAAIAPLRKRADGWNMPSACTSGCSSGKATGARIAELRRKMRTDLATEGTRP